MRKVLNSLTLAFLFLNVFAFKNESQQPDKKYNILFIAVDDLRPELGCYGNTEIISPHIDRLADEAILFNRAYCQTAICMPSRVSLLSGVRPENFTPKGEFVTGPADKHLPGILTLPQLFRENGYQTVSVGKIYHHNNDDEDGWTRRHTETFTYDGANYGGYSSGYQKPENKKLVGNYMNAWARPELMDSLRPPAVEMTDTPDSAHPDGFITEAALKDLKNFKKSEKPFFLALGYYRPHLPFTPPKKYWDLYERDKISPADNPYLPKNGIGYHDWNELRRYGDIPREGPVSEAKARELRHGYYASVSFIDAQVGRVMAELEKLGLSENTIVVLWGDHGWNLEEHGLWCKHSNYEISTRTAMMIKVPEITTGEKTDALAGLIDIYPTLCALTGISAPETVEGESLIPLITGRKKKVKEEEFSFYGNSYSMRTDRYRFTKYFKPQKLRNTGGADKTGIYELYDHQNDPDENFNIAYEPGNADLVKALEKRMEEKGFYEF